MPAGAPPSKAEPFGTPDDDPPVPVQQKDVVNCMLHNRRYVVGSNPGICRDNQPDVPPDGMGHAAAGESGRYRAPTPSLLVHRVTPVTLRYI